MYDYTEFDAAFVAERNRQFRAQVERRVAGHLTEDEFNTGVYDTVDSNDDKVVTVEEEGWFEGWFDGDDVEAEIEEVGDVI